MTDPTQPGPTADRIAELEREIAGLEYSGRECNLNEHGLARLKEARAELSRLRDEQPRDKTDEWDGEHAKSRVIIQDENGRFEAIDKRTPSPAPSSGPQDVREAPSHTDLMVRPETLDAFMEANPLPSGEAAQDARVTDAMVDAAWRVIHKDKACDCRECIRAALSAALAQSDAQRREPCGCYLKPGDICPACGAERQSDAQLGIDEDDVHDAFDKWMEGTDGFGGQRSAFFAGIQFALRRASRSDAQPVGWQETLDAAINFIADEYRTREYEDQGEWLPPEARAIHAKLLALRYGNTAPHRPDASGLMRDELRARAADRSRE